jgi:hypothetical protein
VRVNFRGGTIAARVGVDAYAGEMAAKVRLEKGSGRGVERTSRRA